MTFCRHLFAEVLKKYFTVGAIFVAILARAELETGGTTPLDLDHLPEFGSDDHAITQLSDNDTIIKLIWPIVTFMVVTSVCRILRDNC